MVAGWNTPATAWGGVVGSLLSVAIGVIALVITVIVVAVRYLIGAQPRRGSTTLGHRRDAEASLARTPGRRRH